MENPRKSDGATASNLAGPMQQCDTSLNVDDFRRFAQIRAACATGPRDNRPSRRQHVPRAGGTSRRTPLGECPHHLVPQHLAREKPATCNYSKGIQAITERFGNGSWPVEKVRWCCW
jgi:hypothetical protein